MVAILPPLLIITHLKTTPKEGDRMCNKILVNEKYRIPQVG
jgi:hypothetical protein